MTWTPDIVRARFVEASEIERRMFVKGMTGGGNAWPSYRFDEEDMSGWDDQARQDHLEQWQGRKVTKSPELTRWEEVYFYWTPLIPERRRSLVWRFAQCRASGSSFSKYCENKGLIRMTAYNRLDKVFETLASRFLLEGRLVRLPEGTNPLHQDVVLALQTHTMDSVAPPKSPSLHPPFRTEKHLDTLTTPEACDGFAKHLASHNRAQARKREKALRGVPGEQEAA
jgi:hypothetical protein